MFRTNQRINKEHVRTKNIHTYIHTYIYIYIYRERERERGQARKAGI